MGAAYGACDILEDITLDQIFAAGRPMDRRAGFWASLLTRAKFATLFFALPAMVGWFVKSADDAHLLYSVLKTLPLLVLAAACLWTPLARVLWACRVSVVSVLSGYFLFGFVIQAQDLFADTTFGADLRWHIAYWTSAFAALAFIWALPVHYAARLALEGERSAWYAHKGVPPWLVRWTPRILGAIPVIAVLLGIFGGAVETRQANNLEPGLPRQYVLLSLAGWFTLGFVMLVTIDRRRLVRRYLKGPNSARSELVVKVCIVATSVMFALLFFAPLYSTQLVVRAALVPLLLGSGVLLFGYVARFADRVRKPVVGFAIAAAVGLTALNSHFNEVRHVKDAGHLPAQASFQDAVRDWRAANNCPIVNDENADKPQKRNCPPALIVAADGGASRAAYFAAAVLGEILDQLSARKGTMCGDAGNPGRCIFAMSGVSGGSLGLAAVKAALVDAQDRPPCRDSSDWKTCLKNLVAGDYLSAAFVGLAFRDQFAPPVWPFTNEDIWGDRAVLLENAWEGNYLEQIQGKRWPFSGPWSCGSTFDVGLCRAFAQKPSDGRWTPLLMLNGTSVETGRRIIASELKPIWTQTGGAGAPAGPPQALHSWAYDLFDILGASCPARAKFEEDPKDCASTATVDYSAQVNVRLSTAALLSARFPIISPAGTMWMAGASDQHGAEVVDGGYFENSGLTTALDIAAALHAAGLSPIVVSISNDPIDAPGGGQSVPQGQECQAPPPALASGMHLPVGRAAANSPWNRAVDILNAPFAALSHTRDGHADEAGQALTQRLASWDFPKLTKTGPCSWRDHTSFFPIRVYKQGIYEDEHGTKIPYNMPDLSMSWWLSPVERKALDGQLTNDANRTQVTGLISRLSAVGCPDCETSRPAASYNIPTTEY
jgi:hypothetical protein